MNEQFLAEAKANAIVYVRILPASDRCRITYFSGKNVSLTAGVP